MKKILLTLLCIGFCMLSYGQKNTFAKETAALNCFYISFKDGGVHLKNLLKKAEHALIEVGVLKDNSGESYLNIFKNLEVLDNIDLKSLGLLNLITEMMVAKKDFNMNTYKSCVEDIVDEEGFKESKAYKNTAYLRAFDTAKIKNNASEIWSEISKRFTAEDFTHDYYKLAVFIMIETYKTPQTIEEIEVVETPAFMIMLEGKNMIKVNAIEVSLDELKEMLKMYYQIHTSNSKISLSVDGKTMMNTVGDVKKIMHDVVKSLREELALEKYKRSYDTLMQEQQQEINEIYPRL